MNTSLLHKDGVRAAFAAIVSILIGLAAGSVLVLIMGLTNDTLGLSGALDGMRLIFGGLFATGRNASGGLTFGFNPASMGNMLFRATPLILTGLSVAVAYKTGLFNIGAPGQYLMGTAATLVIALGIPTSVVPAPLLWLLAFVGGVLAGALWGCLPGLLKAFLNINEVLACIMTNWISANLVTWIFDKSQFCNMVENTKTGYIYKTTYGLTRAADGAGVFTDAAGASWTYVDGAGVATGKLGLDKLFPGSQVNGGILIAIVIAVAVYILMTKTTLGYQLKACGANRHAARYAGISDRRNIVLSMAIAGALAGAAASLYYLSGNTEFYWTSAYQSLPAAGFNGIPVALLAANHPIAVIFTGMFMSMLNIVGLQMKNLTAYNEYIADVIVAVIVYLSAFSLVIKLFLGRLPAHKAGAGHVSSGGETPPAQPEKGGEET